MSASSSPSLFDSLHGYISTLTSRESEISKDLDSITQQGKPPSLADMMNVTFKTNTYMAGLSISMTTMQNVYKMLNAIAQRAPVAG